MDESITRPPFFFVFPSFALFSQWGLLVPASQFPTSESCGKRNPFCFCSDFVPAVYAGCQVARKRFSVSLGAAYSAVGFRSKLIFQLDIWPVLSICSPDHHYVVSRLEYASPHGPGASRLKLKFRERGQPSHKISIILSGAKCPPGNLLLPSAYQLFSS
jgi:hypothetical protein